MSETERFNPRSKVRTLRGKGPAAEYLDVKWRLVWFRDDYPQGMIDTEVIRLDDETAIFKAVVSTPDGGRATGHGSETRTDFGDYIEKAETKAIGRALNALGYGAESMGDDEAEAGGVTNSPAARATNQRPAPDQRGAGDEATRFWRWAKDEQGLPDRTAVEQFIQREMHGVPFAEVAKLIRQKRHAMADGEVPEIAPPAVAPPDLMTQITSAPTLTALKRIVELAQKAGGYDLTFAKAEHDRRAELEARAEQHTR